MDRVFGSDNDKFYRALFLQVSTAAPNYDEAAAEKKWDDLYGAADQDRDVKSSWPSLRHFARQHGYVDPLPPVPGVPRVSRVTTGGNFPPDPLRFTTLPLKDAVARINTEFLVLRTSGKIYQQDTEGELRALRKQDFTTALGGRWVEIVDGNATVKRRRAADVWVDAPERREYRGFQYCPNKVGLKPNHLNLWRGWGDVEPAPGDCSIITNHILNIVAETDQAKSNFLLNWLADILQNPTRKPGGVSYSVAAKVAARA